MTSKLMALQSPLIGAFQKAFPQEIFDQGVSTFNGTQVDQIVRHLPVQASEAYAKQAEEVAFGTYCSIAGKIGRYGIVSSSMQPCSVSDAVLVSLIESRLRSLDISPVHVLWKDLAKIKLSYSSSNLIADRLLHWAADRNDDESTLFIVSGFSDVDLFSNERLGVIGSGLKYGFPQDSDADEILGRYRSKLLDDLHAAEIHLPEAEKIPFAGAALLTHPWQDLFLPPCLFVASARFHTSLNRLDRFRGAHSPGDYYYRSSHKEFVPPVVQLEDGRLWFKDDIKQWLIETPDGCDFRFGTTEQQQAWEESLKNALL